MATEASARQAPPLSPTSGSTLSAMLAQDRRRQRSPVPAGHGHGHGRLHHFIPACGRPAGAAWSRSSPSSQLMIWLQSWGASFMPKSRASVARDLEARRRTPSPSPPQLPRVAVQGLPRHEAPAAASASVPERRPLREREELAAQASAAGPKANAEVEAGKVSDLDGAGAVPPSGAGRKANAEVEAGKVSDSDGGVAVPASAAGPKANAAEVEVGKVSDGAVAVAAGPKANAEEAEAGKVLDGAVGVSTAPPITPVGRGEGTWLKVSPKKTMRSPSLPLLQTDTSEEDSRSPQSLAESPASSIVADDDDKFLWADKYRSKVLNEFIYNKGVAAELYQMAVVERHFRHLIFEGPPAAGKRSMVMALIRDAFGPEDLKMEEKIKRFELKGEIRKHIDVRVRISEHHVEVSLADLHGYEKYVITTLLNESIPSPNSVCDHTNCRVIVLHDADKLSCDLQHYIGWFLGRYTGCNKIIFCCSDASNLEAVKHLCKVMTLQAASFDEIITVLDYIAAQEKIDLSHDLANRITSSASNNLRQAIRSLEATWKANYPFIEGQPILTGWEEDILNVARNIMEEPCPKQLFVIRAKIKKLIEHDVSPHFIFSHLVAELKRDKDEEFQHNIDELALDLNHCKDCTLLKEKCKGCKYREATLKMRNMNIGFAEDSHDHGETIQCFIKIEEFTVRFMSFYRSLNSNTGGNL